MRVSKIPADPETQKFYRLMRWLNDLGCCRLCSMGLAIEVVERSFGRPKSPIEFECKQGRACEKTARKHWKERPRT